MARLAECTDLVLHCDAIPALQNVHKRLHTCMGTQDRARTVQERPTRQCSRSRRDTIDYPHEIPSEEDSWWMLPVPRTCTPHSLRHCPQTASPYYQASLCAPDAVNVMFALHCTIEAEVTSGDRGAALDGSQLPISGALPKTASTFPQEFKYSNTIRGRFDKNHLARAKSFTRDGEREGVCHPCFSQRIGACHCRPSSGVLRSSHASMGSSLRPPVMCVCPQACAWRREEPGRGGKSSVRPTPCMLGPDRRDA